MGRKLASVQKIWAVEPIKDADRIELVHVLGWQCVSNKGDFNKGDLCIYFEIDSFLPERPEFEFLRSSSYKESPILGCGFRLRTMKFRGQISQGLVLPLSKFPSVPINSEIGTDVTELLGVKKWDIEERATTGGTVIGTLPQFVPHTDETRIQAEPGLLEAFRNKPYYITTKMDGSSHSISIDSDGFHVTGHNFEYKDNGSSCFYEFVKKKEFRKYLEEYIKDKDIQSITVQGEFCAPGIQKNRLKLQAPAWYVFTVLINGKRVNLHEAVKISEEIHADFVPIEETGMDLCYIYPTIDDLLKRAEGSYPNGGPKEGIVIRTIEPEYCPLISAPLSMKVINNKYLLKNE